MSSAAEREARRETDTDGVVRRIGHDEFTPIGTAALVTIYFLIVLFLWAFMYFVEFLGRGPTVVG